MRHAESYTSRRNSSEPNIYEEIGSSCYSEYGLPQMLQQQANVGQQGSPPGRHTAQFDNHHFIQLPVTCSDCCRIFGPVESIDPWSNPVSLRL